METKEKDSSASQLERFKNNLDVNVKFLSEVIDSGSLPKDFLKILEDIVRTMSNTKDPRICLAVLNLMTSLTGIILLNDKIEFREQYRRSSEIFEAFHRGLITMGEEQVEIVRMG